MKKKRFFVKQHRNQNWTEEQTGRKIEFADKYLYNGSYSDKFDYKRPKQQNTVIEKEKKQRKTRKIVVAILSIVLIVTGYTGMELYMHIMAKPAEEFIRGENIAQDNLAQADLQLSAKHIESVGLDNSVMLKSIIDDLQSGGYTSVVFDAKREDGTIGYTSSLAAIDTYSAISSPATKVAQSINELTANDILPIARICCYKDNVVPSQAQNMALYQNGKVFADEDGNTYLNPNSQNAYNYIKDIVQELNNCGVNVFILYSCDLPEEIVDNYHDGFDQLVTRLNNELGTQIKFVEEVSVTINGENAEEIDKSIKALPQIDKNQIYKINTNINHKTITQKLADNGIASYVIYE